MSDVHRLSYIGSKYQLIDWIFTHIRDRTGWSDFKDKKIADLFAGTGIVSWNFRNLGAQTTSNDAELYSSFITSALALSEYTPKIKELIDALNVPDTRSVGFVTRSFSPFEASERMFFSVENAQRIDWMRNQIEEWRPTLTDAEYSFLVASLLIAADSISNVPAVYGMYLKNFKDKAKKNIVVKPIHTCSAPANARMENVDVLQVQWGPFDAVYLDPPYNERQYSKNYFPLNIIAMTPEQASAQVLHGKTGIPDGSFVSPFCQKRKVETAFETLFNNINSDWIFMSYNSESLVTKDKMMEIMGRFGKVEVIEMDYKRFKSFEYNEDKSIKEYLFSLQKS
jgi:adenine-specific DNA-methyltransferase